MELKINKYIIGLLSVAILVTGYSYVNNSMAVAGYPQPVINNYSPDSGPISGGTKVTINGNYFDTLTGITVDGVAITPDSTTSGQIVLTMPAHLEGGVDIVINTNGGTISLAYTYYEPEISVDSCNKKKKVAICHLPPGNTANTQQLCLPKSAIKAHLDHGDYLGQCK